MYDPYDLRISDQQQQILMTWDKQHPVSGWERELDRRVAARMGHHNLFVTGERIWSRGHRNSREGIVTAHPAEPSSQPAGTLSRAPQRRRRPIRQPVRAWSSAITNSQVYHLPVGCPSYNNIGERNQALGAGFRRAGNCH